MSARRSQLERETLLAREAAASEQADALARIAQSDLVQREQAASAAQERDQAEERSKVDADAAARQAAQQTAHQAERRLQVEASSSAAPVVVDQQAGAGDGARAAEERALAVPLGKRSFLSRPGEETL